jgi:hypothetical protein
MSTIAERARAEADEAEREEADKEAEQEAEHEEEAEHEAQPETEPAPSSQKAVADAGKKLEAEAARHDKRVREIMGDDFEITRPCPACFTPGFVFDPEVAPMPEETREAILAFLGDDGGPKFKAHPDLEMCSYCDGYGELTTGSRNPGALTEICPRCSRQGYVAKNSAPSPNGQPPAWVPPPPPAPAYDTANVNKDEWGRPIGSEHYGQDPRYNGGVW